ncbi:MAG TPA: polysaccharide biosynthesis C-terminal domain-containing protein [Chitinophagales bacterium]|nr:polysaccharide biosynthesis C-terminal domain-containing protein [Chitinophagales bacterium]
MGILQRQSIKSSIATYIGVAIGTFNFMYLFPKFLLPEQLGLTRVMIAVAVIFSQISLIGTPAAMIRFFPYFNNKQQQHHGFVALMFRIALVGFILVSVLFLILKNEIQELYLSKSPLFSQYYLFVFPIALFLTIAELAFNYCRALLKFPIPTFIREVMLRIFQSVAIIFFILHLVNFKGFIFLFIGTYFLHMLLMIGYVFFLKQFFFFTKIRIEEKVSFRQILRFSLFSFAASSAAIYTANIDTVLLGMFALDSVAVYSIAFFIGTIIQIPGRSMNVIAASMVAEAWKNDDRKKIQELYTQTSLNQLLIGGFIFLLVWVNVDGLLSILPPVYAQAKWVIFIVGIGKLFDMATGINAEIIFVSKHVKVGLVTNLFLIIIATVSNYFLIRAYDVYGAAAATVLSLFLYNIIRMVFLFYEYRLQPFNANTLKAIALLLVCFGVYYFLPSTKSIWLDGIYRSIILSVIFVFPLLIFNISPEINSAYKTGRLFIFKDRNNTR